MSPLLIAVLVASSVLLFGYALYLSVPDRKVSQNGSVWLSEHPAGHVDGWEITEVTFETTSSGEARSPEWAQQSTKEE